MSFLRSLSLSAILVVSVSPAAFADDAADDLKALQGSWSVSEATSNGVPIPDEFRDKMTFIFEKDVLRLEGPLAAQPDEPKPEFPELRFTLNTSNSPRSLDLTALNGPQKGTSLPGIYEVKGDTLKFCAPNQPKGTMRPTEFAAQEGSNNVYFLLKRKPAK